VLIVGSGQSGCQIAEELCAAGRDVVLACGRVHWAPRRLADRDLMWWLVESGLLDQTIDDLAGPGARLLANILATGHGGGHDIHFRTLQKLGITLAGHFLGADGQTARFAPDLHETVAWSDERHADVMNRFRTFAADRGIEVDIPKQEPFDANAPEEVDLRGFGAVVFTSGFRPDYASWVEIPDAFDELGFPMHDECESTVAPGLYFVGVHFLRKRKSSLLVGVGEDAAIVAQAIEGQPTLD
jgi:putative flavoprotein involved in K+ transport